MNSAQETDGMERQIDAALSRLPHWQPPADFHRRLAAAAWRQHQLQHVHQPAVRAGILLQRFTKLTLIVLACTALAAVAAWLVPWSQIAMQGSLLVWTSIVVLFSYSGLMTWRQLRRPGRTAMWSP